MHFFLNVFIFILHLYMFRVASAHHQEVQSVSIHHLVQHTLVGDWRAGRVETGWLLTSIILLMFPVFYDGVNAEHQNIMKFMLCSFS